MENLSYKIVEYLVLLFSVLIGSGAFISFVYTKNKQRITAGYIVAVLLINLFWTYFASEFLKVMDWARWSAPALVMVAFCGQYLADWLHRRAPYIFDHVAKKAGFNLNHNKNDNNNPNTTEDENQ